MPKFHCRAEVKEDLERFEVPKAKATATVSSVKGPFKGRHGEDASAGASGCPLGISKALAAVSASKDTEGAAKMLQRVLSIA